MGHDQEFTNRAKKNDRCERSEAPVFVCELGETEPSSFDKAAPNLHPVVLQVLVKRNTSKSVLKDNTRLHLRVAAESVLKENTRLHLRVAAG